MTNNSSLGRWISVLYRYGQCYLDTELKKYNIGSGQFIFLVVLSENDGVTQEYLANLLDIDKATTARAIKKLEDEGYVIRKNTPDDKRARIVYLTTKGQELIPKLMKLGEKWTAVLTTDFSVHEKKMIFNLLEKLAVNATKYIREDRN